MVDILVEAILDSLKTLPFLFIAYLAIEFIEHRSSDKLIRILSSSKLGVASGALLGLIPQCGFSVTASNLFAGGIITPGTLLAVFLSTSDEAIPLMLSVPDKIPALLPLLACKLVIALAAGFITDLIFVRRFKPVEGAQPICRHCNCNKLGIVLSSMKHTLSIFCFILLFNIALNLIIFYVGEDNVSSFLMSGSIFQPFLAAIFGLIPNCAASVLLTQLYIDGSLSFASVVAGLATGAGIGLAVLFRVNKDIKMNFIMLGILYLSGALAGFIIELAVRLF